MGALPTKKKAVVAIEAARRRRRLPAGPEKPNPPLLATVGFAVAVVVAVAATAFGLRIVFELIQRGSYVQAAVAPFWVIVPGCAPLFILIRRRRRAARATHAAVIKPGGRPHPKPRPRQNVSPLKRK
jgi:hypothetical protein